MVPIVKIKKRDQPYVVMDQRPLNDERLSWKAKGLLAYLLSKPNDWQVWVNDLQKRSTDGEHSVRSALIELRECGYVIKRQARQKDGTFGEVEYEVHELPLCGFPDAVYPLAGYPDADNQVHTNKDSTKKDTTKKDKTLPDKPAGPKPHPIKDLLRSCEDAWGYPTPNGSKEAGAAKWLLKRYPVDDIIGCLRYMRTDPFWGDKHVSLVSVKERVGPWLQKSRPSHYGGKYGQQRHPQHGRASGGGAGKAAGKDAESDWFQQQREYLRTIPGSGVE